MNLVTIWIIAASVLGQSWGKPIIQEAEIAAPVEIEKPPSSTQTQSTQPNRSQDSWDLDSNPAVPSTSQQTQNVRELRWEYDEEGQPVARPAQTTEQQRPLRNEERQEQKMGTSPKPQQEPQRPSSSKPVATFWLVVPR